jgi:hypothetical protein
MEAKRKLSEKIDKNFFSPETKLGSEIMRKILSFASFEAKKFPPSFRFEAKITKLKQSKKFKAKKNEKSEKSEKSEKKQENILEYCFASFPFEAKITKAKRSEKFEAKISERSEKREEKFYSEIVM